MIETTAEGNPLDVRRRRLSFRAWHRGMREMDLILGRFADRTITELTEVELLEFERLIELPDRELLGWITGELAIPAEHDGPLLRRVRQFHLADEGVR